MKNKTRKRKSRHPLIRFFKYRILHIGDSPHRISLGLAIGLFIAFSPIVGLHLPLVMALALLLRANKFIAIMSVWACNIFTLPIICYSSYVVGWAVVGSFRGAEALGPGQVGEMVAKIFSFRKILSAFYQSPFWVELWNLFRAIGPELVIGGSILGGAVALLAYYGCLRLIKRHRKHNPHRRFAKHQ